MVGDGEEVTIVSSTRLPVLVIGGGPAGLALGHELKKHSLEYLILEKSDEVGATFATMTESTTYGPWLNNLLPGSSLPLHRLLKRTTRNEYARYLAEYRREHGLSVLTSTSVEAVERDQDGFSVVTSGQTFRCQVLVNATGYFSKPNWPNHPGREQSEIPCLHSAEYVRPETVVRMTGKVSAKVLIVGSRLSAGEIMEELHEAGHQVHLSHREPIDTWPSPWEEALISPIVAIWEWIALKIGAPRPGNLIPRLRRGTQKRLLDRGLVPTWPEVYGFHKSTVKFIDGRAEDFDLVLYATGYRAALDHLQPLIQGELLLLNGLESIEIPDCYFMGMIDSRTFRSQFLRGIRDDAVYLGELLAKRLETGIPYQPKLLPTTVSPINELSSAKAL